MRRMTTLFPILFLFLCAWIAVSTSVSASPLKSTQQVDSGPSCHHLQVHLQGKQVSQTKCLDSIVCTGLVPLMGVTGCDSESLILYWDFNSSGDTVCFDGSGSTDLTSYCAPWDQGGCLSNWSDQASSFQTNDVSGGLYADIGDNGQAEYFSAFASANLDGSGGRIGNDAVSSVNLQSCRANDNLGDIANNFISRCRRGSIRSVFPGQDLNSTLGAIKNDSSAAGKTAWKLLNDNRFTK